MAKIQSGGPQAVGTPQDFFDHVAKEFNFTLDLAASSENAKVAYYIGEDKDSLATPWHSMLSARCWAWLNPPFKYVKPWLKKCISEMEQGARIVMLVKSSVECNWFRDHVWGQRCEVRLLCGRLQFSGYENGANFGCMLIVWDDQPFRIRLWDWQKEVKERP